MRYNYEIRWNMAAMPWTWTSLCLARADKRIIKRKQMIINICVKAAVLLNVCEQQKVESNCILEMYVLYMT